MEAHASTVGNFGFYINCISWKDYLFSFTLKLREIEENFKIFSDMLQEEKVSQILGNYMRHCYVLTALAENRNLDQ